MSSTNTHNLKKVLSNWKISDYSIDVLTGGLSTENWRVCSDNQYFVLRNTGVNKVYAQAQIIVLEHLKQASLVFETPILIPTIKNHFIVDEQDGFFYLYGFIFGEIIKRDETIEHSKELGVLGATYYESAKNIRLPNDSTIIRVFQKDNFEKLWRSTKLSKDDEIKDKILGLQDLEFQITKTHKEVYLGQESFPAYSDFQNSNILLKDNHINGLLDFGSICLKPRISDMMNIIKYVWGIYGERKPEILKNIIEGFYEKTNPMTSAEKELIQPLMIDEIIIELNYLLGRVNKIGRCEEEKLLINDRIRLGSWLKNNKGYIEQFLNDEKY